MIEEIKLILTFISLNLIDFIKITFMKITLFFIALMIIIPSFFIALKSKLDFSYIIIFTIIIIIIAHILKERLFIKSQYTMNYKFLSFILKEEKNAMLFSKNDYIKFKKKIKKLKNVSLLKKRVIIAHFTASTFNKANLKKDKELKRELFKIHIFGYGFFLVLILFFELISLVLAMGNRIETEFIFFLSAIGFIFAYAVFSITVEPIVYLLIQRKIIDN